MQSRTTPGNGMISNWRLTEKTLSFGGICKVSDSVDLLSILRAADVKSAHAKATRTTLCDTRKSKRGDVRPLKEVQWVVGCHVVHNSTRQHELLHAQNSD